MSDHEKSAELEGQEAIDAALSSMAHERALLSGAVFDDWYLRYLLEGDSAGFRVLLKQATIAYLKEVKAHKHVIKAAIPGWVYRLLEAPMQTIPMVANIGASSSDISLKTFIESFRTPKDESENPE